jgi:uncharacterized protein (DUF305 family)
MKRHAIVASIVVFALPLAACGASKSSTKVGSADSTPAAAKAGSFNDADVAFAQGMIPHHEQAIEMADMALDPNAGAGTAIMTLAKAIKGAQDPEIKTMKEWLSAWGKDASGTMAGMDHSSSAMPGMMSAGDMTALGKAKGPEFDGMWAKMMIAHHSGAIEQANTEIKGGKSAEAKALAAAIVKAQQAEIDQMKPLAKA